MRRKILLVDDNEALRSDFPLWFRDYDVTAAADWAAALKLLSRPNEYELVVLDVQLPDTDGLTALGRLKSSYPGKKVVIMTGFSTKDTAIHALTAHADGYVEKPFELSVMRDAIERVLGTAPDEGADLDGKIRRVKRFVEDNIRGKFSLADAAAVVFLSPKYLSRAFRERTGTSFEVYKQRARMKLACELLRGTSESVKQISLRLGYANAESFIRQFEKIVKQKPSCYRRNRRCRPVR